MLVPMKVDYGVRILVHLASLQPDAIEKATEISKKRHIPEKFLFQISNELIEKKFIKGPPINKTIINEVNKDNPVLKVMYLKTFKNPKVSTKLSKNW